MSLCQVSDWNLSQKSRCQVSDWNLSQKARCPVSDWTLLHFKEPHCCHRQCCLTNLRDVRSRVVNSFHVSDLCVSSFQCSNANFFSGSAHVKLMVFSTTSGRPKCLSYKMQARVVIPPYLPQHSVEVSNWMRSISECTNLPQQFDRCKFRICQVRGLNLTSVEFYNLHHPDFLKCFYDLGSNAKLVTWQYCFSIHLHYGAIGYFKNKFQNGAELTSPSSSCCKTKVLLNSTPVILKYDFGHQPKIFQCQFQNMTVIALAVDNHPEASVGVRKKTIISFIT